MTARKNIHSNTKLEDARTDKVFRGDIYLETDLTDAKGSEQGGVRPCIVVSNNLCNKNSPVVTVVPITTKLGKADLPTHLELDRDKYRLRETSIALAEQVISVDKSRLTNKHDRRLDYQDLKKLDMMLKIQLGLV